MQDKIVFTATEARQNFFELLRLVDAGKEPVIKKEDSNKQYKVIGVKKKKPVDKLKILKEMGNIGLTALPIKKMKKIYSSLHDIKI